MFQQVPQLPRNPNQYWADADISLNKNICNLGDNCEGRRAKNLTTGQSFYIRKFDISMLNQIQQLQIADQSGIENILQQFNCIQKQDRGANYCYQFVEYAKIIPLSGVFIELT